MLTLPVQKKKQFVFDRGTASGVSTPMDSERPRELRDPRDVASEKALLEMIRKDPPGTRYRIDHRRVQMGENPIKITILHVL